ncbi:MAG: M56 family metallopeptidase [Candidatus Aminicenantes bacterium]|nr:M56 family metallopeptidase [Candidatus Aminicenantes bacterium]
MSMESLLGLKYLYLICEFMIKSSLVLGGSLLLFFLFRKKSASMRHFLLSFSLISLLLLPFLSTFITGWETRLLPSWQTGENSSFDINEGNQNKDSLHPLSQKDTAVQANGTALSGLENTKHQDKKTVSQKTIDKRTILGLSLITIWTAGLGFLLIRIFLGLYGAHRLTRQGKQISGPFWQLLLQRFLNAISIRRKISLLCHDQVRVPLTWGVFKPVVIMPAEAENWNRDECSSALFHELSHVKRSDFLFKILARFSCALYWFNPLSWFVFRLMRKEQEKACDELVLQAGVKPSTYAANLLSIQRAGQIQWNPPSTVLGAVGKSQLNERLMAILKQQLKPKEVKMKTKILLSVFVMAAITFIGLARPAQSAASNTAIFLDNAELMTEIQNSTQAESVQEEQEKKKTEKAEKKEPTEKQDKKSEITWILKDGKKVHISLLVDKDEKGNKIIVTGKPVIIVKEGHPEKGIVLSISGKDLVLKKCEEGHWTLKTDKLHLINEDEDKVIKLDEDTEFTITIEKGKDDKKIHIIKAPEIHIKKAVKVPMSYAIHIEGGKKTLKIDPHGFVCAVPLLDIHPLLHLKTEHKKMREKLEELRDKLKKIKELKGEVEKDEAREEALRAVEEVLEELREELEKKPKELEDLHIKINPDLKYKLATKFKNLKTFKDNFVCVQVEGDKKIIGVVDKDGGFQIIIKNQLDSENKAKYEEILKKLKEELPEDYEAESEIDEEENTITIKITTEKKDEKSKIEVKELVKKIVDELKKMEKK